MVIDTQATFTPPLEIRLFPVELDQHTEVVVRPELIGGSTIWPPALTLAGTPPTGMSIQRQKGRIVLAGTPTRTGTFSMTASISDGTATRTTVLPLVVRRSNLARSASKILAAVTKPTGAGSRDLSVLRDGLADKHYDSFDGRNRLEEDYYGYEWPRPVQAACVILKTGPRSDDGGWFETLAIQYRDQKGQWTAVAKMRSLPAWSPERSREGQQTFEFTFDAIKTTALRIVGQPGGKARFTSVCELAVYPE